MIAIRSAVALLIAFVGVSCSPAAPVDQIRELLSEGEQGKALELARLELEENPDQPALQILYSQVLMARGEFSLAEWPLRRAARSPEFAVEALLLLAHALNSSGNAPGGIEVINRVLELKPDDTEILEARSRAYLAVPDGESALADAEAVLEEDPDHTRARVTRLHALLILERAEEAEAVLQEVIEAIANDLEVPDDHRAKVCALESRFALEKGDRERSYERIGECVEEFPANKQVVKEAISVYQSREEYARLRAVLEGAVELSPDDHEFRVGLAQFMRAVGEYDEAESLLREGIESHDPQRVQDWRGLYEHLWQVKDYAGAIEALETSIALHETPEPAELLMLADTYVEVGDYTAAEKVAEGLAEGYRDLVIGRVRLEQGDPARAREAFLKGIRIWPNNAAARVWLGLAAAQLGDMEDALNQYTEAFRIEYGSTQPPEKSDSAFLIARIQAAAGLYPAAQDFSNRHVLSHPDDVEAIELLIFVAQASGDANMTTAGLELLSAIPGQFGRAVALESQLIEQGQGPEQALVGLRRFKIDPMLPSNAIAFETRVRLLGELGRHDEAVMSARKAIELGPGRTDLLLTGARALAAAERYDEARALLARVSDSDSDSWKVLLARAQLEEASGSIGLALDSYDRAAASESASSDTRYRAAKAYLEAGRLSDSRSRFRALLHDDPFEFRAASGLAAVLVEEESDLEEALALARRGVDYRGRLSSAEAAWAFAVMGRVQLKRGAGAEAEKLLLTAIQLDPELASAREALARARESDQATPQKTESGDDSV